MADFASDLFTWNSLGTLSGLTGATVVITNTAARAFAWSPKWFGLAVALVLCLAIAAMRNSAVTDYALAVLNACLVYLTAAGANAAGAAAASGPAGGGTLEGLGDQPSGSTLFPRWF